MSKSLSRAGAAVAVFALAGCAPAYDRLADEAQLQAEIAIDSGLRRLALDAETHQQTDAAYAANAAFYANILGQLAVLQSRYAAQGEAGAREGEAVGLIAKNIEALRVQHAAQGTLGAAVLDAARAEIGQQFRPLDLYQTRLAAGGGAAWR